MSENEKKAAAEVVESLNKIPDSGVDFVRGYLQGRLDGLKDGKENEQ